VATARDIADQMRALNRIARLIRDGSRPCNLDACWIEAAASSLADVALEKRKAERAAQSDKR
jgi:hypothetical protein